MTARDDFLPTSTYDWRGHSCAFVQAGQGPPVVLIHGFAGSAYNCWRSTVPALAATHTVYAVDLLGLGASDQPADVEYSIDLWVEQCADFLHQQTDESPIIIGHSFGSVVALQLASQLSAQGTPVRGVGMMNCGYAAALRPRAVQTCPRADRRLCYAHGRYGLNNKNVVKGEEWRQSQEAAGVAVDVAPLPSLQLAIFRVVLGIVDWIFNQRLLLALILDSFATAENVRGALEQSVYTDASRVDDDLVEDYLSLAKDRDAAVEVLRQIYTNDAGPLPFPAADMLPEVTPMLIVWGDNDNLGPVDGPVGSYFRARSRRFEATRFEEIVAGHVPQDDNPEATNRILGDWLAGFSEERSSSSLSPRAGKPTMLLEDEPTCDAQLQPSTRHHRPRRNPRQHSQ